jgi:FNIP Repeat
VIAYSLSSILLQTTHLVFILFNNHINDNKPSTTSCFPSTLISLTLKIFDKIDKVPFSITQLVTSYHFNQAVDKLPPSVTHLTTGYRFNQPVDKLPPTLTHLTTGDFFNQSVDKLPPTLTHLITGHDFNQLVDKLPSTLTHLTVGMNFKQPPSKLPTTLTCFTLSTGVSVAKTTNTSVHLMSTSSLPHNKPFEIRELI